MIIFERVARVRVAQARAAAARGALSTPAASLLVRSREHPLTTVGAAAGAGFVLGSFNVHPLRVPGLGPLLSGGLAEAIAFGTRLITELATAGLASAERHASERSPEERSFDSSDTSGGAP